MKVALLTCIAFTTGVCWLVNQVSRQPESPAPRRGVPTTLMSTTVPPTDRLSRPSASEASRTAPEPPPAVAVRIEPAPASTENDSIALPPIVRPIEPAPIAAASVSDEPFDGGGGGVMHVAQVSHVDAVPPAPGPAIVEPALYKVVKGDSLSRICTRTYGADSPELRKALFELNPKIAKRPNCLYAGETLKLPVLAGPDAAAPTDSPRRASSETIALQPDGRSRGETALPLVDAHAIVSSKAPTRDAKAPGIESVVNATRDSFTQRAANSPGIAKKDASPNSSGLKKSAVKSPAKTGTLATKQPAKAAGKTAAKPPTATVAKAVKPPPRNPSKSAAKPAAGAAKGAAAKSVAANAGATKSPTPSPAKGKSKSMKPPPAVAKDAKRSAAKPARASSDKPVTRRRGGAIDAG